MSGLRSLPALLFAGLVCLGLGLAEPRISALMWAIVLGVALSPAAQTVALEGAAARQTGKTLLKIGVALMGLRISATDLSALGFAGVALAALTIVGTMLLVVLAGRWMHIDQRLTLLIAAGSAICGASAIAAVDAVADGGEARVATAVATVTIFGTLAMIAVPLAGPHLLGLSPHQTGIWAGASIHEVGQVAGAGSIISAGALKAATLVKLTRVAMLAPVVMLTAVMSEGEPGAAKARVRVPGFLIGFVLLVALRSTGLLGAEILSLANTISVVLLAAGLFSLGLQISPAALRQSGMRPLLLGFVAWLAVGFVSLGLVAALY